MRYTNYPQALDQRIEKFSDVHTWIACNEAPIESKVFMESDEEELNPLLEWAFEGNLFPM